MNEVRAWVSVSLLFVLLLPVMFPAEPASTFAASSGTLPTVESSQPTPVNHDKPAPVIHAMRLAAIRESYVGLDIPAYPPVIAALRVESLFEPIQLPPPAPVWSAPDTFPVDVEFWRPWVEVYDWPVDEALAIIACESSGNANAVSPTNDYGLFQHHLTFWADRSVKAGYPGENPLHPGPNIGVAYWLYTSKGNSWQDWTCARTLGL